MGVKVALKSNIFPFWKIKFIKRYVGRFDRWMKFAVRSRFFVFLTGKKEMEIYQALQTQS